MGRFTDLDAEDRMDLDRLASNPVHRRAAADVICEMWERLRDLGLTGDGTFEMPVTQEQLGDAMGLTAVHVNRVLQRMRAEGLITLQGRRPIIHGIERMRRIAGFDPLYLHRTRRT